MRYVLKCITHVSPIEQWAGFTVYPRRAFCFHSSWTPLHRHVNILCWIPSPNDVPMYMYVLIKRRALFTVKLRVVEVDGFSTAIVKKLPKKLIGLE